MYEKAIIESREREMLPYEKREPKRRKKDKATEKK
tara:strand:+ start:420 stop:524 length:105 start_codon:yes stop_codon:yes gene_type:complete